MLRKHSLTNKPGSPVSFYAYKLINSDVLLYEHSGTVYISTDVMLSATGAKYHTPLPQVNANSLLIIIILQFVFVITQYTFAVSVHLVRINCMIIEC